jgi:hypothetical protein
LWQLSFDPKPEKHALPVKGPLRGRAKLPKNITQQKSNFEGEAEKWILRNTRKSA